MSVIGHAWVLERDKQTGEPIVTGGPDDGEHGIPPEPGYVEVISLAAYRGAVARAEALAKIVKSEWPERMTLAEIVEQARGTGSGMRSRTPSWPRSASGGGSP